MATKHATVEDYFTDDSDGCVLEENFPRRASPTAQANSSTKRSHPELNTEKAPAPELHPNIDLKSDSGYSSYTAASKSSADSAPSTSSRTPPAPQTTAPPIPPETLAPKPRRPTIGEQRQHGSESSSRSRVSRAASVSSKIRPSGQRRSTITQDPRDSGNEDCSDPNCTTCVPNTLPSLRRPALQPSMPSDQRSQRSDPNAYYTSPPSPTYTRPSIHYSQGLNLIQPSQSRRRSSSNTRPRPQTIAGEPGAGYWVPGMPAPYPSPPQEQRGPPPSMSAYQNMQYPHIPPYMASPAQPTAFYPQHTQTSPPYDVQRPPLSMRGSSSHTTRSYPAAIITHENEPNKFSARYGQQPLTPSEYPMRGPNQPRLTQLSYEDEGTDSEASSGEEYEYDNREPREREARALRALMPPPKIKRPPLSHAKTTQVVDRLDSRRDSRRQSIVIPRRPAPREWEREHERERDRASQVSTTPMRRKSVSRPPPPQRQTQSEYDTRHAHIVVNNSKSNRRQSYQGHDKTYEALISAKALEEKHKAERRREKRASRIYEEERHIPGQYDDDEEEEEDQEEQVRALTRPRRKTDTESRKGKERISEGKNKKAETAAEEYIKSTRGSRDPYADQINRAAKRASRIPSAPSESGSSSGKQSMSKRTDVTGNNNEIRLRVDGSAPLSLQFTGDMEGRTLQLLPAENGMTDVVIGNARGGETSYRGERGSVLGSNRKSIIASQARREAEDMISERSSRSGRSRREHDDVREVRDERGHVLRRSRNTTYH